MDAPRLVLQNVARCPPSRLLILFAHPALEKSRVNRRMIEGVLDLDGITFHDLYEAYPDFVVDVEREQELLSAHDLILFQHPFYWYSTPALLKEWQDLVLQHGWAYGTGGTALRGKRLLSVITTGGSEAAYCQEGYNLFTMRELLRPIEQTARLCGMEYLPPFIVHGTHSLSDEDLRHQCRSYREVILALRDGRVDFEAAASYSRLNSDLDRVLAR